MGNLIGGYCWTWFLSKIRYPLFHNPNDYISFSTGIDYETFDENDDIVKDVRRFISQVLPEKEVREYILKVMGSFLCLNYNFFLILPTEIL